jgi:hypothetical protein
MQNAIGTIHWVDDVVSALRELGGQAPLYKIYRSVEIKRSGEGRKLPEKLEETIRRTIQDHSSDSRGRRGPDLFKKVSRGVWRLRE